MNNTVDLFRLGYSSNWVRNSLYESNLSDVLNEELRPASKIFIENMKRVRTLAALVPDVAYFTRVNVRIADVARSRLGRDIPLPGRIRGAPPIDDELKAEILKLSVEWYSNMPPPNVAWQDGCDLMRSVVDQVPDEHGLGLEVLMSAMLLETWAAVEAFVGDIWTIALNLIPDPLAIDFLGNEKNIPINILKKFQFNIGRNMGDVIRILNKVDMNSLSGIKIAYKSAFANENTDEIFDCFDPDIAHFEAIRNLYAHKSGKVDERFMTRVAKSIIIPKYNLGDKFKINGDIVSFYTGKSVDFATQLFLFVDRWIYAQRYQ